MKKNFVTLIVTAFFTTGVLVGCGSQQDTVVSETTIENTSAEEVAVEATTEETVEESAEEVSQIEERKVLAGKIRKDNDEYTDVMSYIYDENGEVVKAIYNNYEIEELATILESENLSADDFMNFGEKYIFEYIDVTKSENGRLIEGNWFAADGTDENDRVVYTYTDAGSELTKDEYGADWETHVKYTYNNDGNIVAEYTTMNGEVISDAKSDDITSEVDEDKTLVHVSYTSGAEVWYFYTTIEVSVQQ